MICANLTPHPIVSALACIGLIMTLGAQAAVARDEHEKTLYSCGRAIRHE